MGRSRGGGPRFFGAVIATTAVTWASFSAPATAASGGAAPPPTTAPTSTTTTLPPLPAVDLQYTDGQPAQALLNNAVALASLGLDDSALANAVAVTQAKLDTDAVVARNAEEALTTATQHETRARASLESAEGQYTSMAAAVRQAVIFLYTSGPASLTVSPTAGRAAMYAQIYADSTVGPYGVLARRQAIQHQRAESFKQLQAATADARKASAAASKALADEQTQMSKLKTELASASTASAVAVTADHAALASEAGKDLLNRSSLQFTPKTPLPAPVSTTPIALSWAFAELGKQYVWGATGPDTFDCSGLTQFAWKAAGVSIPRVAADQDAWTIPVPLSDLLPGDLVFFGTTDIHHVGIYIGNGLMINAPHTGTVVQVSSIWWSDLAGFGRVHSPGTPVPPHDTPTPSQPAVPVVVPTAGLVPSQTKPPAGWKPTPGSSTPISLDGPAAGPVVDSTSTTSTSTTTTTSTTTASTSTTSTTVDPAPVDSLPTLPPDGSTTTTTLPWGSTTTSSVAP